MLAIILASFYVRGDKSEWSLSVSQNQSLSIRGKVDLHDHFLNNTEGMCL